MYANLLKLAWKNLWKLVKTHQVKFFSADLRHFESLWWFQMTKNKLDQGDFTSFSKQVWSVIFTNFFNPFWRVFEISTIPESGSPGSFALSDLYPGTPNSYMVPSSYNILRWVTWTMGQTNRWPRVWCSMCYFFFYTFYSLGHSKLFIFVQL